MTVESEKGASLKDEKTIDPNGWLLLDEMADWIESSEPRFHIQGRLTLTKGSGLCDAWLYRRRLVEHRVRRDVDLRVPGGISGVARRFADRYGGTISTEWPEHFAADVLRSRGPLTDGNIFLFFPWAAGIVSRNPRHHFGLELINVWEQSFHKIVFPAMEAILDSESCENLGGLLKTGLSEVIYMASQLHEVGHRVGPFRVIPNPDPKMNLSVGNLLFDACGELTADALMVALVPELEELAAFVTAARLIFFPRKGYDKSRGNNISSDNDALLAPVIWHIAREHDAIYPVAGGRFHIAPKLLRGVYTAALDSVDALGQELISSDPRYQAGIAKRWMQEHVDTAGENIYCLPAELSSIYDRLRFLPEYDFQATLSMDTNWLGDISWPQ